MSQHQPESIWQKLADRVQHVSQTCNVPMSYKLVEAVLSDANEASRGSVYGLIQDQARPKDPTWDPIVAPARAARAALDAFGAKATDQQIVDWLYANASEGTRGTILFMMAA